MHDVMSNVRITLEEKPPLPQSVILAIQHILAAFNGIIAVPLVVGGALQLASGDLGYYVSCAIFCAGIVTIIQTTGFFGIGARLPCVMGTSFTFVGPSVSVGQQFGMAGLFTATVFASLLETGAAFIVKHVKKLFPKVVVAAVISLIGLSLIPVAVDWSAGGVGAEDYGSLQNLAIAMAVIVIILILNSIKSRFFNTSAVFFGMLLGYVLCLGIGRVDFMPVAKASWFNFPTPFYFGFEFQWTAILPFLIAYLVTTVETIGDLTATARVSGKQITNRQLKGGILADGVGSAIGGILNGGANTTFTQNIGIISLTGVASLYVVRVAGIILILLGICPKLGALVAVMPLPVLGGAGLVMFGMVAAAGMSGLKEVNLNCRNLLVFTLSIVAGLAVVMRPQILKPFPDAVKMILSSSITTGAMVAIFLNLVLPKECEEKCPKPGRY